tara:strand:- start:309 stop:1043 length:735 start_codon:yes stop_codon:yes gene_type:complete
MIEKQSDNIENPKESLENNLEENSSDPNNKKNVNTSENSEVNSETIAKEVNENSNNTEDTLNTVSRLEQLEKEHQTLKNQYVRIAADFDNFRKRQSRDQDDLKVQLICNSLSAILPIVDNFERARQQLKPESDEAQTLHRSYQGLYKQLVEVLKQQGVAPMRVLGQHFDPNLHEAVLREPSEEEKEDIIIEELQRGYHLDGKVLRHALVKVSMGPGPSNVSQEEIEKDKVEEVLTSNKDLIDEK